MTNEIDIRKQINTTDYVVALVFSIVLIIICAAFSTRVLHWFLLPLVPCGVLIGVDAVGWFRGKYDLFDPKGMLGLMGLHFFFISYLLTAVWEVETPVTAVGLEDYRPWMGVLAVLNCLGLIIYRFVERSVSGKRYKWETAKVWICNESNWGILLTFFIIIGIAAQVYLIFGRGYVGRLSYDPSARSAVKGGTGILRLIGGSGPIFLIMLLTLIRNKRAFKQSSMLVIYLVMGFMGVFTLFSGGLVGSRGTTVWNVFWIGGIVHFFWRRITVKQALMGLLVLVVFMNIYGFFKKLGTGGLKMFMEEGYAVAAAESGVHAKGILIGDLSRTTVNAYMAYVLVEKPYSYEYWWGKTFIGDILVQFPTWIYSNYYNLTGTSGKMRAGTDLMMGAGHYDAFNPFSKARYIYGLTGQVMLNYGILPIPLAFIVLGYFVGRFRRAMLNWKPYDMRFFLVPIFVHLLMMLLTHDFENQLNTIIFNAALPFVIVLLISFRVPRSLVDAQNEEAGEFVDELEHDQN